LTKYRRFARETFQTDLRVVRTDNDPCFTNVRSGQPQNVAKLQAYLDTLKSSETIRFELGLASRVSGSQSIGMRSAPTLLFDELQLGEGQSHLTVLDGHA
jgi:hypothetical protein